MKLDSRSSVKNWLVAAGLIDKGDEVVMENLSGGVSSRVWKIMPKNNCWVIKQALEKLKVQDDWFSDVERIHREHEVMDALFDFLPAGAIPKVLHVDYINHIYMMTCAKEEAQTWKDILMKGEFSNSIAANAGFLLRRIHHSGNNLNPGLKTKLQDQKYFIQLRVEPFHRCLMQKYAGLSSSIQILIDELTLQKTCLVHGDFSPKNMLVEKDENIVLIDFEVAHWGNPVFDVAYCIGHLMLKGWHLGKQEGALKLIEVFLEKYDSEVKNLIPHLGLMLLARMDGKSPVNYIREEKTKDIVRKVAISWIQEKAGHTYILQSIQKAFLIE